MVICRGYTNKHICPIYKWLFLLFCITGWSRLTGCPGRVWPTSRDHQTVVRRCQQCSCMLLINTPLRSDWCLKNYILYWLHGYIKVCLPQAVISWGYSPRDIWLVEGTHIFISPYNQDICIVYYAKIPFFKKSPNQQFYQIQKFLPVYLVFDKDWSFRPNESRGNERRHALQEDK